MSITRFLLASCLLVSLGGASAAPHYEVINLLLSRPCTQEEVNKLEDYHGIFVRYLTNNRADINGYRNQPDRIPSKIKDIMAYREEKVIYLIFDDELTYSELSSRLDALNRENPDIYKVLISDKQLGPIDPDSKEYKDIYKNYIPRDFREFTCVSPTAFKSAP